MSSMFRSPTRTTASASDAMKNYSQTMPANKKSSTTKSKSWQTYAVWTSRVLKLSACGGLVLLLAGCDRIWFPCRVLIDLFCVYVLFSVSRLSPEQLDLMVRRDPENHEDVREAFDEMVALFRGPSASA